MSDLELIACVVNVLKAREKGMITNAEKFEQLCEIILKLEPQELV